MGPTKVIVNGSGLYEAVSGKLIKDGFGSRGELEDYVNHHYLVLTRDRQCRQTMAALRKTGVLPTWSAIRNGE